MEDTYKEVYFDKYCTYCKHLEKKEDEKPCYECLNEPMNLYSHKPVNWEGKKGYEDYLAPRPSKAAQPEAQNEED